MALINSVYNYYLSTYASKELNKSDVHKKSELRSVYNAILTMNKKSPLFKVNSSENLQKYAIDIKENAMSLKRAANVFDEMSTENPSFKNKAVTSDETVASAEYIGDGQENPEDISLSVIKLATPQINQGGYLNNGNVSIAPGKYSFDIGVGEYYYEFHTSVKENDTNLALQERVARLINNSKIGVLAGIKTSIDTTTSLSLQSSKTGITDFNQKPFIVAENQNEFMKGLVNYLGIGETSTDASNAAFTVNGIEKTSPSNVLNIANQYEVTLNNKSLSNESITISVQEDYESFINNVRELADNYNSIVKLAKNQSEYVNKNTSLGKELSDISKSYKNQLDAIGLTVSEEGTLQVDESLFAQSIREGSLSSTLEAINSFKKDIITKANSISINPMQYVNKTMISYPHPVKPVTNPYVTSIYSGMMYNNYV